MPTCSRRTLLKYWLPTYALLATQGTRALQRDASAPAGETLPHASASPDLLGRAHALLTRLPAADLTPFLSEWPQGSEQRGVSPSTVPVLRWLPSIQKSAPAFSRPFVDALVAAAASLAWQRSYSPALVGTPFYDNYGWTELAGLSGPTPSEHLACGLLLLGSGITYPSHRHEADEIYVPLAGTAEWKHGDDEWRERPPGSVIHHGSVEPHAMRTGPAPMLALYLWRSANLAQKSQLDDAGISR